MLCTTMETRCRRQSGHYTAHFCTSPRKQSGPRHEITRRYCCMFQSTAPWPSSSRASLAFLKHSEPMNGSGFLVADSGEGWAQVRTRCFDESISAPFFCDLRGRAKTQRGGARDFVRVKEVIKRQNENLPGNPLRSPRGAKEFR